MAEITFIPKRFHEGIKQVTAINPETYEAIIDGLSLSQLTSSLTKLAEKVSIAKSLSKEKTQELIISVGGLCYFIEKDTVVKDFVENVFVIANKEKLINEEKDSDSKQIFKDRLLTLLTSEQLFYASKASHLAQEFGNLFVSARLMTDIRPVFRLDTKESPQAGMIFHHMHVHYRRDHEGDHKDIYFTLDSEDISTLKELLTRAETKQKSLQEIFNKSGMINLNE
jgi:hypothetical protein